MAVVKNRIPLFIQESSLKRQYPNSVIFRDKEKTLSWKYTVRPTPLSLEYTVKLKYSLGKGVKAYVIDPKPLPLAKAKHKLPHVYSTVEQQLCLYYPDYREWHPGLLFAKTIVPWIIEWLYFYEIWLGEGEWLGGGIDHAEEPLEAIEDPDRGNCSRG